MKNNLSPVEIFFAADENYFPCLSVALASLSANSNPEREYRIHVLAAKISKANREALRGVLAENCTLSFVNPSPLVRRYREKLGVRLRDYYSESIYYRLFLPQMFPCVCRGIYLDCDIVVLRDVGELFDKNLCGAALGAVADESVAVEPTFCAYTKNVLGIDGREYFNSGVLLMDLAAFRREKIAETILRAIEKYNFETVAPDQDYLNAFLRGNLCFLPSVWNKHAIPCRKIAEKDLAIVHYNMFAKPWHYSGVPYEKYFWKYAECSPWSEQLKAEKENYSEESKRLDREAGKRLLCSAKRISGYPKERTFSRLTCEGADADPFAFSFPEYCFSE